MASRAIPPGGLRIGEVAEATGMTVRALRHYEDIGLLAPAERSPAGYRLYRAEQLERLYHISLLRSLGMPLSQITATLAQGGATLRQALEDHIAAVDEQLAVQVRLRGRLAALVERLGTHEDPSAGLLNVLEDMAMLQPVIDRRLSILVYEDLEGAAEYLSRVFALGPAELTRDEEGTVIHAEIRAGDGDLWLHRETSEFRLASPRRLGGSSATMAVFVEDVDEHHRHAVEQGATIHYEPIDQPYGFREYSAVDLEGHLWSFMKPIT